MNNKKCAFSTITNECGFCFCSPSHSPKATPKPAVKGEQGSCILPLTAVFCVVLQDKATGSGNKRNTARSEPYCSPEQKKNRCASCVKSGELSKKPLWVRAAKVVGLPHLAAPHGFVFADSHGSVLALTESHRSITGGYLLTKHPKNQIKRSDYYGRQSNHYPEIKTRVFHPVPPTTRRDHFLQVRPRQHFPAS